MKNYTETRETYKAIFKKYPEISNLYGMETGITVTKTEFVKSGSRWKEIRKETETVGCEFYYNVFDAVPFFRNLGGYERTEMNYTKKGYIPVTQVSISPDKTKRVVWHFTF